MPFFVCFGKVFIFVCMIMNKNTRGAFINRRNYVLVARYYYWTELERRRFDDALDKLSNDEFFVSERTITNALNDFADFLDNLISNKATPAELRKMFPSWNWEVTNQKKPQREVFAKYLNAS